MIYTDDYFQSHFGLILSIPALFNIPALVLLSIPFWSDFIPRGWEGISFDAYIFQSHFGLILSPSSTHSTKSYEMLSIPFWSDFIVMVAVVDSESGAVFFQSHFGLILSKFSKALHKVFCSPFNPILVWFYLTTKYFQQTEFASFQSHFGLILSFTLFYCVSSVNVFFQSHFGLILSSQFLSQNPQKQILPFNPILVWFYLLLCSIA